MKHLQEVPGGFIVSWVSIRAYLYLAGTLRRGKHEACAFAGRTWIEAIGIRSNPDDRERAGRITRNRTPRSKALMPAIRRLR